MKMQAELRKLIDDQNIESGPFAINPPAQKTLKSTKNGDKSQDDNLRSSIDITQINSNFTIINKEVIDPESYDINSQDLPEPDLYPGTNWKWNQFNMKRLMMSDVKEHVQKMIEESTTKYSKQLRIKQEKLVKRLFKKRHITFDITPNMSEKKKKLTRIANAIIVAARKMREQDITLEDLMAGKKKL